MSGDLGADVTPPAPVEVRVDGVAVQIEAGVTALEACDSAEVYVPRLCFFPGLGSAATAGEDGWECGLCVVRLQGGTEVLACSTIITGGESITTDDEGLRATRHARLAAILAHHPHICLGCPDRDGCARDECSYGTALAARCCDQFGRCELGAVVEYIDAELMVRPAAAGVSRAATTGGRIRREPGLCIGCGRCVRACASLSGTRGVLQLVAAPAESPSLSAEGPGRVIAAPRAGTLRGSGCTFCGLCVMVCPAGAISAPGPAGARWLADRRARHALAVPVPPPETRHMATRDDLASVPTIAGTFELLDGDGRVLRISGVADLRAGLGAALSEPGGEEAVHFRVEPSPLYTQRETELLALYAKDHGQLPPGNEPGDELFEEDLE